MWDAGCRMRDALASPGSPAPLCKPPVHRSGHDGNRLGKLLALQAAPGCWGRAAGVEVRAELPRECAFSSALSPPPPFYPSPNLA